MLSLHRAWNNSKSWQLNFPRNVFIVDKITVPVLFLASSKCGWIVWPGRLWARWPVTPVQRTEWQKKSQQKSEVRSLKPNSSPVWHTHAQARIFMYRHIFCFACQTLCKSSATTSWTISYQECKNVKAATLCCQDLYNNSQPKAGAQDDVS